MTESNKPSPLRVLRQDVDPVLDSEREAARRARVVGRIHELQRTLVVAEPASRFGKRWSWIAAAAAIALSVGALLSARQGPLASARIVVQTGELSVESAAGQSVLHASEQWSVVEQVRLSTHRRAARLSLPSQASAELDPESDISFEQTDKARATSRRAWGEHLTLRRGKIALQVPHLEPSQHLAVETSDALVEVHGTEFSVELLPAANGSADQATLTRVSVQQGVVSVTSRGERVLLTKGEQWTTPASVVVPAASTAPEVQALEPLPSARSGSAESPNPATQVSDLATQNRMFQAAQRARTSGQTAEALRAFEELMRRFPRSELAHNARVEHFRLLRATERVPDARKSAATYLAAYPNGFARAEAQALVQR